MRFLYDARCGKKEKRKERKRDRRSRLQRKSSCQGCLNNSNLSVLEKLNLIIQPNRKPRSVTNRRNRSKMQYPARFLNPISVACASWSQSTAPLNPFFPTSKLSVSFSEEMCKNDRETHDGGASSDVLLQLRVTCTRKTTFKHYKASFSWFALASHLSARNVGHSNKCREYLMEKRTR